MFSRVVKPRPAIGLLFAAACHFGAWRNRLKETEWSLRSVEKLDQGQKSKGTRCNTDTGLL